MKKQVQSVFASASIGYKNMFYVDMTFRNDWDSSLALTGRTGFDYESVGVNAILSSVFKLPEAINFWKVRGSYATVGLGLPTNITNAMIEYNKGYVYEVDAGTLVYPRSNFIIDPDYKELFPKPEFNRTFEVGTELRMLNNRLNFDITYYNSIQ
jgi:hypothetical protein